VPGIIFPREAPALTFTPCHVELDNFIPHGAYQVQKLPVAAHVVNIIELNLSTQHLEH